MTTIHAHRTNAIREFSSVQERDGWSALMVAGFQVTLSICVLCSLYGPSPLPRLTGPCTDDTHVGANGHGGCLACSPR